MTNELFLEKFFIPIFYKFTVSLPITTEDLILLCEEGKVTQERKSNALGKKIKSKLSTVELLMKGNGYISSKNMLQEGVEKKVDKTPNFPKPFPFNSYKEKKETIEDKEESKIDEDKFDWFEMENDQILEESFAYSIINT